MMMDPSMMKDIKVKPRAPLKPVKFDVEITDTDDDEEVGRTKPHLPPRIAVELDLASQSQSSGPAQRKPTFYESMMSKDAPSQTMFHRMKMIDKELEDGTKEEKTIDRVYGPHKERHWATPGGFNMYPLEDDEYDSDIDSAMPHGRQAWREEKRHREKNQPKITQYTELQGEPLEPSDLESSMHMSSLDSSQMSEYQRLLHSQGSGHLLSFQGSLAEDAVSTLERKITLSRADQPGFQAKMRRRSPAAYDHQSYMDEFQAGFTPELRQQVREHGLDVRHLDAQSTRAAINITMDDAELQSHRQMQGDGRRIQTMADISQPSVSSRDVVQHADPFLQRYTDQPLQINLQGQNPDDITWEQYLELAGNQFSSQELLREEMNQVYKHELRSGRYVKRTLHVGTQQYPESVVQFDRNDPGKYQVTFTQHHEGIPRTITKYGVLPIQLSKGEGSSTWRMPIGFSGKGGDRLDLEPAFAAASRRSSIQSQNSMRSNQSARSDRSAHGSASSTEIAINVLEDGQIELSGGTERERQRVQESVLNFESPESDNIGLIDTNLSAHVFQGQGLSIGDLDVEPLLPEIPAVKEGHMYPYDVKTALTLQRKKLKDAGWKT